MAFLTEQEPQYGAALPVAPGVRRIVACNPSVMTYHGTNTYLIDGPEGVLVLDPGPDSADHVAAIVAATHGQVAKILLTHRHADHLGALQALKVAAAASTYAFAFHSDVFIPDHGLHDGDIVDGLRAIHTPGHAADHICFAREADGLLFSGDHVMSWASSVVSPPGGDMAAYCTSLEKLLTRNDKMFLPGHGPALPEPQAFVKKLLLHRRAREEAIWRSLHEGPKRVSDLVDRLYHKQHSRLYVAAMRNVTAHLIKLQTEGRVRMATDELWVISTDYKVG